MAAIPASAFEMAKKKICSSLEHPVKDLLAMSASISVAAVLADEYHGPEIFLFDQFTSSLVVRAISKRSQQTLKVESEELQKLGFYERMILIVGLIGFPATPAKCDYLWWHRADGLPCELGEQLNPAGH